MADDKKITIKTDSKIETIPAKPATPVKPAAPAKPAAAKPAAAKPAATRSRTAAAKPAAKAPAAAKPAAIKTTAVKPAARKASPAAAKKTTAAAKKATAKSTAAAKPKKKLVYETLDDTDTVKKALWESVKETKAKKLKEYVAIQIYADGLDSFFIAVQDGNPMIIRAHYQGHNGDLFATPEELLKIAQGKFNLLAAVKAGTVNFNGNLSALLKILELFK